MTVSNSFAIGNAKLFSAGRVLVAAYLRIEDGVIDAVGDASIVRPDDLLVDGGGGTVFPGLIDSHVHLLPGCTRLAARFGVTTMLDMFSKPEVIDPERELIAADEQTDKATAADLRTSSIGATAPQGHPTLAYSPIPYVTGPQDAEAFVAARIAEGADHLKIIFDDGSGAMLDIPALSIETISALAAAAHGHGLLVVAHISTAAGAVAVLKAGVDVLAHVPMDPLSAEQISRIADAGVAVISTLSIVDGFPGMDGVMPLLSESVLAARLSPGWRRLVAGQAKRWMPPAPDPRTQRENAAALHAAGVPILVGTDAPNPGIVHGASLHRELQYLVFAGLTPAEALAAATSVPARVFGLSDRGVIEPGMRADLVLVDGDPMTDIAHSAAISRVWLGGRPLDEDIYPGSDLERAGIDWLQDSASKILRGIQETWPDLPGPEEIRRDDGELLGRVIPQAAGWQATTTFGAALGEPTDHDRAVRILHERGLSSLAESWWVRCGDSRQWREAELLEVTPDRLRIHWKDPLADQPPAGQWLDLKSIEIVERP